MADRPFRVLGIQQIAVGGPDKGRLHKLRVETLGLVKTGDFQSEKENVDEDITTAGTGPLKVEVDLMQPLDPDKKPKVHEPPLNHVGLWIDDLPKAVEWLTAQGMRFTPGGIRKGAAIARSAGSRRHVVHSTRHVALRAGTDAELLGELLVLIITKLVSLARVIFY